MILKNVTIILFYHMYLCSMIYLKISMALVVNFFVVWRGCTHCHIDSPQKLSWKQNWHFDILPISKFIKFKGSIWLWHIIYWKCVTQGRNIMQYSLTCLNWQPIDITRDIKLALYKRWSQNTVNYRPMCHEETIIIIIIIFY